MSWDRIGGGYAWAGIEYGAEYAWAGIELGEGMHGLE